MTALTKGFLGRDFPYRRLTSADFSQHSANQRCTSLTPQP